MHDLCLLPAGRVVRCVSMEYEGALLVTLVVGCNVFTEAFFESSASLSEVGFLAAVHAAWIL